MRNDTNEQDRQDKQIQALLRDYPVPVADAEFYERALARAALAGSRRPQRRWMLGGLGAAIAATVLLWVVGGVLLNKPQVPDAATIPGVTISLLEPRIVNLVFASATSLDSATLTVSLPAGVELNGFPGQREITWETSLNEGKNLLPLTLIAVASTSGELLARLEHDDRNRTFRLRVDVNENQPQGNVG